VRVNNSRQEKNSDQFKQCKHGRLRTECTRSIGCIHHKICDHKVRVKCRDKGQEDLLWCNARMDAQCHSCGWEGKRKEQVRCRDVLKGEQLCPMCGTQIQFIGPPQEEVKSNFVSQNSSASKDSTIPSICSGLQKLSIASSPTRSERSAATANNYSQLNTQVMSATNNSSQGKKPDQGKCVHGRLRTECTRSIGCIYHKICGHRVRVKCCHKGQEELLWCRAHIDVKCHSCGWVGTTKQQVRCREVLRGEKMCPMCSTQIQFIWPPEEVNSSLIITKIPNKITIYHLTTTYVYVFS